MDRDQYITLPSKEKHLYFLKEVERIVLEDIVFKSTQRTEPVINFSSPQTIAEKLKVDPPDSPLTDEELLSIIRQTVKYSVKTGHPYFINQLFSSLDPYGFAGQCITDALNCSVYTYEVAPVFTVLEKSILQKMRTLVGWLDGDGIFCPGGSIANGIGMNLARYFFNNDIKYNGICSMSQLVMLASEDAHYSIKKMAAFLGIGENNVILVPTDKSGAMDATELKILIEECLQKKVVPFLVVATSGTTVLGAFDPLPAIASVCKTYNLWLHVDAAWGGGLLFSKTHCSKLVGINQADSVTINPHKLLAVPQQCSVLLSRHRNILSKCYATYASYLFQPDKFYSSDLDSGDSHIQCGRKADVFKFWLMWMAKGSLGFEKHVDSIMNVSNYLKINIEKRPNFKLVYEPQYINVCFWFIPKSLKNVSEIDMAKPDFKEKLHKVAPKIKERMMKKGSLMINYQPHKDKPNFFRFVLQNSSFNENDADYVLNEIETLGSDL